MKVDVSLNDTKSNSLQNEITIFIDLIKKLNIQNQVYEIIKNLVDIIQIKFKEDKNNESLKKENIFYHENVNLFYLKEEEKFLANQKQMANFDLFSENKIMNLFQQINTEISKENQFCENKINFDSFFSNNININAFETKIQKNFTENKIEISKMENIFDLEFEKKNLQTFNSKKKELFNCSLISTNKEKILDFKNAFSFDLLSNQPTDKDLKNKLKIKNQNDYEVFSKNSTRVQCTTKDSFKTNKKSFKINIFESERSKSKHNSILTPKNKKTNLKIFGTKDLVLTSSIKKKMYMVKYSHIFF